jgi:hypothetical protein
MLVVLAVLAAFLTFSAARKENGEARAIVDSSADTDKHRPRTARIASDKPKLILHIGPHKTASTTIQFSLFKEDEFLEERGWTTFTMYRGISKREQLASGKSSKSLAHTHECHEFALGMRNAGCGNSTALAPYMDALKKSRDLKQNLILSSEIFDGFEGCQILELKELLADFDVQLVLVYRTWISQLMSVHYEVSKMIDYQDMEFNNFLMESMDTMSHEGRGASDVSRGGVNFIRLADVWTGHFPNFKIIDLAGVKAAGIHISAVFLCDAIGMPCDKDKGKETESNSVVQNARNDELLERRILFEIFLYYATTQRCRVANKGRRDLFNNYDLVGDLTIPYEPTSQLAMLVHHSQLLDERIREKYPKMLYSDPSAAEEEQVKHTFRQISKWNILTNMTWATYWDNQLIKMHEDRAINCNNYKPVKATLYPMVPKGAPAKRPPGSAQ